MNKPPSTFKQLLEEAGVVFCNEPLKIQKPKLQSNSPTFSWEKLIEKLIS